MSNQRPLANQDSRPDTVVPGKNRPSESAGERLSMGALARIEEAALEHDLQQKRDRARQIECAEEILREARAARVRLFGAENHDRWHRYRECRRAERSRSLPPWDAAATMVRQEQRDRAEQAAAGRFLQELGVDVAKVREAADGTGRNLRGVLGAGLWTESDGLTLREPDPVLTPAHGDSGIEVAVHEPPFSGTSSSTSFSWDGAFQRNSHFVSDRFAGKVGQLLELVIGDATDADLAVLDDHHRITQGFLMPHSGKISVIVEFTVELSSHHLVLRDEFGLSLAETLQTNAITFNSIGSNGLVVEANGSQVSLYVKTGRSTGQWISQGHPDGTRLVAIMLSKRSYAQGEIVRLDIGSHSFNRVFTDDMEVTSRMSFRYAIDRILVSVLS